MRRLNGHDVFMAFRAVNILGIRDEIKKMADMVRTGKEINQEETGFELIFNILGNAGDERAEKAVFAFLAGPMETTPEDLAAQDLEKLFEDLKTYKKDYINAEIAKSFFGSLGSLMK